LFEKLAQKNLLDDEANALIESIINSSIISQPDIDEIFDMTVSEGLSNRLTKLELH
jgi:hypothetical protein